MNKIELDRAIDDRNHVKFILFILCNFPGSLAKLKVLHP